MSAFIVLVVAHLAPIVAWLGSIGVGTWLALILIDTVLGILTRSGNGGTFSWSYIKVFLVTNFATSEARVMLGLIGTAGFTAAVVVITSGHTQLVVVFEAFATGAVTAFVGAVAAQDLSLLKDIFTKLGGQTQGQLARKAALKR